MHSLSNPLPLALKKKAKLEGTWLATGKFGDGFVFTPLITFAPSSSDDEGTLVQTSNMDLVGPLSSSTGQGVWQKTAGRSFIASEQAFFFDATNGFAPAGTLKIREAITITDSGNEFTGRLHVEGFDTDGNQLFSDDVVLHGVRARPEAPPALP